MLNERQLKIVDLLEQQPRTPGELAQQTGVSGRTILRDIDYLNFTLINYAPCRRGDMWSRSVHYTCMEKGICRKCCAKKMANIAIGPSKRNFIFLLLCRHFKRRCNSIVAGPNSLKQENVETFAPHSQPIRATFITA